MGVIHKLKDEVISFIIQQKENNPSISVRQLAFLAGERFQIKISKSSVSTLLKNASLSSSVGRRSSRAVKGDKFSIPSGKKKEILENMNKARLLRETQAEAVKDEAPMDRSEVQTEDLIVTTEGGETAEAPSNPVFLKGVESDAVLPAECEPIDKAEEKESVKRHEQDFYTHIEALRTQRSKRGILIPEGAGFILFKAAEWEMAQEPRVADLIAGHLKKTAPEGLDKLVSAMALLQLMGGEEANRIFGCPDHGLWTINDVLPSYLGEFYEEAGQRSFLQACANWSRQEKINFAMEYGFEKEQMLSEISHIKLFLEDQTELVFDAGLASFAATENTLRAAPGLFPLGKTITWLSQYLISNMRSAIFHKAPEEPQFFDDFYNMISIFECGEGRRILKAGLYAINGDEMVLFSTIPTQRRGFMIGIGPKHVDFQELTKSAKWAAKRPYYHAETETILYFSETKTNFFASKLSLPIDEFRLISLWREGERDPFWGVLSNRGEEVVEGILNAYISRWPYIEKSNPKATQASGNNLLSMQDGGEKDFNSSGIDSVLKDYAMRVHDYVRRRYFSGKYCEKDLSYFLSNVYNFSGKMFLDDDVLKVSLVVDQGSPIYDDLNFAVRSLNDRLIRDYAGRRLWLEMGS